MHGRTRSDKRKSLLVYSTQAWQQSQSPDLPYNAVVAKVRISDPYEPAKLIDATHSIKNDPLAAMLTRGDIDRAQFEAGRKWQRYYEKAEIGGARGLDTTKTKVDGGTIYDPIADSILKAISQLSEAKKILGQEGEMIIRDICGLGRTIQEAANIRNFRTRREREYLGRRLRECLETLAELYQLA